jgi:predicted porin
MNSKKYILALLFAAGFSVSALAQDSCCVSKSTDVQIYGRLDAGVITANSVQNSAGKTVSITQFTSSPMYTSNIGFKATERINSDLAVYGRFEAQVQPMDGSSGLSSSSGASNALFGRESNIGIVSRDVGTVIIGRQVNPVYQAWATTDVRGPFSFGASVIYQADGSSFGGTATSKTGIATYTGGTYISNAVSLTTREYNGIKGVLLYGSGNVAGDNELGQKTAIAATYNKGMFTGTTGYYNARSTSNDSSVGRYYWVGAGIRPTDKSIVKFGHTIFENPTAAASNSANSKWALNVISGEYNITPVIKVFGGYFTMKDQINSANKNTMKTLGAEYELSKRTQVYTAVASVTNEGTAGWAAYGGGGANAGSLNTSTFSSAIGQGKDQTAFTLGVVHRF